MDQANRRWTAAALLALAALALFLLAPFLPYYVVVDPAAADGSRTVEIGAWARTLSAAGPSDLLPSGRSITGVQQVVGVVLVVVAGLVAAMVKPSFRGRKIAAVILIVSGVVNLCVSVVSVAPIVLAYVLFPAAWDANHAGPSPPPDSGLPPTAGIGIGGWCLLAGLLLMVAVAVVAAKRKREPIVGS